MSKLCNVALVGTKFMGRAHSNAWLKVNKFFDLPAEAVMHTLIARDPAQTAAFAARWGWRSHTNDALAGIRNSEIDVVDVTTPNNAHRDLSIAALEAGKHVACEKPLAASLSDARAMLDAAKKARKSQTFVWYNYRRCPAVALAHQLVKEGRLGRIYQIRGAYLQDWAGPHTPLMWRFQGDVAGSGALGDLCAHTIDAAKFITGDEISEIIGAALDNVIKERVILEGGGGEISGRGAKVAQKKGRSDVDDISLFLARTKAGAVCSFEATRLSTGYKNQNRLEIHGDKGAIRFAFERMNELDFYDNTAEEKVQGWNTINVTNGGAGHPYAGAWWPVAHVLGYEHSFVNMAADIVLAVNGKPPVVPLPDFADAYNTQRVLEAVTQSAKNKCAVKLSEIK